MLVTLIEWLKTHYQPVVLQEIPLSDEQLQPLADIAKALMGLFANQHLLEKDEIPFVIEGLLIIAECYVAQRYNRLATEQQLKFLIREVQPTLTILAEKQLVTLVQQQDFEARIATFQADVLAHQQGNWRNGSAIEEILPYAQKLVQLEGYIQGLVSPHTQAERKLNQLEANFLFDKANFYVEQRLAGLSLSATERLGFENAAEQLGQLLQLAHLKAKALCCYSQLLAIAINQQWSNWRVYLNRVAQVTTQQMPKATALWRHYQQLLTQYRHTLQQQLVVQPAPALAQFNTQLIQFTQQLWQESEQLLGPSPVEYCILALGSMSQQMLSAYSDVEYALLTENAEAADWEEQGKVVGTAAHYIKTLCEVFEFKVVSIGESNTGYKLDNNSQPRTEPSLRGTPDQLVEHCLALEIESHDGLVYSLLHATPLQGDHTLFETFHTRLQQAITQPCTKADHGYLALTKAVPLTWHQYWALAQFKRNEREYIKYLVDKKETPDLKKPYLKLLRFMVLDLALYLNLPAQHFNQACEQLVAGGYLPADVIAMIKEHVNYLLIERSKLHLARGKEDDSPLPEHQVRLEQIQQTLLAPYFDTIHLLKTQGFALWQQAFWLACVPHHLSRQRTTVAFTLLEAGFDQEKFYLPLEFLKKVFAANSQIRATTPERNSAVFEWGSYCLKIQLPDAPKLESQEQALQVFIAREYVVNQLSRALGWLVTPAGCAIKLEFEVKPGQTVIYYGWLSQRLVGRDLENAKRQQPALLKSISPEDYTALFLLSLLIYPEDGQPRNFMIVNNTLHQPAKLYSLDNKRVFVDPIEVITSGFFRKTQTEQLKLKTCLYFLPQFKAELSAEIWQQCQQLDLAKVRENLLSTIQAFDRIVIQTLTEKKSSAKLVEYEFRGLLIPPYVLYSFLFKLEHLLARIPNVNRLPTAAACLKQCEPEIYKLYEKHLVSTVDYYQVFRSNYRSNQFEQNFSKATLDFIQDNRIKAKALGQQLLKVYPKFAISISWKDLPAEQQYHLLQLLQGQSLFELDLSDCLMLKNENLEEILKASPQLKLLNISNCPHLSPIVFKWFSRYCKQLETLIVDNNFWLKHLEWTADLNNLTTLSLKKCNYLEKLDIKNAKKLTYLYIPNTLNIKIKNTQFYADAFNARASEKLITQKYQEAIEDLDYAIRLYPKDYAYYFNRGSAKITLKEYQAAAEDWYLASELFAKSLDKLLPDISNLLFDSKRQILEYISDEGAWPDDLNQLMLEGYTLTISETVSAHLKAKNYYIKGLIALLKESSSIKNNSTAALLRSNFLSNLGWMWTHGVGCRKNVNKAFVLYKLAVNSHERAKFNLAFMYANGWGCETSENKTLESFKDINVALTDLLSGTFTVEELKFLVGYGKKNPRWLPEFDDTTRHISEKIIKFSPNNAPLWSALNETYSSTLIVNTEKLNSPAFPFGAPLHFSKTYVYLFTLVINQNPDDTIALLYRAYSNLNLNNYQAVLDDVEELIRLNSEFKSDIYFLEGYALNRLEKTEKAIASYKKALEFKTLQFKHNAVLYNNIALELASLGFYTEAIENCNCAIKLESNLFVALYNRGVFNLYFEKYEEAIDDLTNYLNLDSDFGRAFAFRGFAKYKLDLLQEAIDDFELGMERNDTLAAILLGFLQSRGIKIKRKIESLYLFFQQLSINASSLSKVKVDSKSFLYYLNFQAEKLNLVDAHILLGIIYRFGLLDADKNDQLALNFFSKAASEDDNYAKEFVQKILDPELIPKAEIKQISQLKPVSKDEEVVTSFRPYTNSLFYSPIKSEFKDKVTNNANNKASNSNTSNHSIVDNGYWYSAEDIDKLLTHQLKNYTAEICAGLFPFLNNFQAQAAALFNDILAEVLNKDVPAVMPINLVEAAALNEHGLSQSLQGTHWIGICVIPINNHATYSHKIMIVDSLGNGLNQDKDISALNLLAIIDQVNDTHPRRAFWEKISQLVGLMQGSIVERDINKLQIIVTGTIQQTNGSDCGAFVVQNLVSLLQENKLCEQTGGELRQLHAMLLKQGNELADQLVTNTNSPSP